MNLTTTYLIKRFNTIRNKIENIRGNENVDRELQRLSKKYDLDYDELAVLYMDKEITPYLKLQGKKYPFEEYGLILEYDSDYSHYDDLGEMLDEMEETLSDAEYEQPTLKELNKLNAELDNWEYFYNLGMKAIKVANAHLPRMEIYAKELSIPKSLNSRRHITPRKMKGIKTAVWGKKSHRESNITSISHNVRKMF